MPTPTVPLRFFSPEPIPPAREPVTVGLPWPRGLVTDAGRFRLAAPPGQAATLQTDVLARWADGSIKWCLFDFFAIPGTQLDGNTISGYGISVADTTDEPPAQTGGVPKLPAFHAEFVDADGKTHTHELVFESPTESGPVRARLPFRFSLPGGLRVTGWFDWFPTLARCHGQFTLTNPHPADHPGGNWDLGNGGSREFASLSLRIPVAQRGGEPKLSAERGQPQTPIGLPLTLHQESSGGENWRSGTHVDMTGRVNLQYCGYKLTASEQKIEGLRATPVISVRGLSVGVAEFWQNFPMALRADEQTITIDFLPALDSRHHELQGGEQKTWQFRFGIQGDPLGLRSPLYCSATPQWYCDSGVVPNLTPEQQDPHADYITIARQSIEGNDTFLSKRETIDEYGWRNYGDIYGDHEAVYHPGPTPLVSHDNNQYDCVLALLQQHLRAGDFTYLDQALACALHTADVDIYHTTLDKSAYNGGLFWHTYHYADAGTGAHRSYPKSLRAGGHFSSGKELATLGGTGEALKKVLAVGGGPAGSHNYNAGLALAYTLTGNTLFRDASIGLADYVISSDAPRGGVIGLLSRQYSGLASESSAGYHGPGRASGNSVLALLCGYQLTGDERYLDYADAIIRRVSHPGQNLERLQLLNAELRWFYTMFLQSLGVYLQTLIELGHAESVGYAYGRAVLLHYAAWMAERERPILDAPDELQYPTETWAAQDLRKVEVFDAAAEFAEGDLRDKLQSRAREFHKYCAAKLLEFPTRSLCRPVVLVMRYGWSHLDYERHPGRVMPAGKLGVEFGEYRDFVPQKQVAVGRAKKIALVGTVIVGVVIVLFVWWLVK